MANFLLADSWLLSTLDVQLTEDNIARFFGACYSIYGPDHIVTKYMFDKFYDWYGYNKATVLSFLGDQLDNGFYSTRYLYSRVKDFLRKHRRFWQQHPHDLQCSLCTKSLKRFSFFHGPAQNCVFLKCCFDLVHWRCFQRIANHSIDHCRKCQAIWNWSEPNYSVTGFYFGYEFHEDDRKAKHVDLRAQWPSTHAPHCDIH